MDYNSLADKALVLKTSEALTSKGYTVLNAQTGKDALRELLALIPPGATVASGTSVTLEEIGYVTYASSGKQTWTDLRTKIRSENDTAKRAGLRRQSALADYYLGSVHALTRTGEFLIASKTGSQLPNIVYTSPNLIFVISTKKIVPDLDAAMKRLKEYVVPLEDKHMMDLYKVGTAANKIVIFSGEAQTTGRKIYVILVNENLGF